MRALLLALMFVGGCAQADDANERARYAMRLGPDGNMVPVLELTQECPEVMVAPANGGCASPTPVYVIFYPRYDQHARQHELDHVAGMRHGPWVHGCALITVGGHTAWWVGNYICGNKDGSYYQRAP